MSEPMCARVIGGKARRVCGRPESDHWCRVERCQQHRRYWKQGPCSCFAHHPFVAPTTPHVCPSLDVNKLTAKIARYMDYGEPVFTRRIERIAQLIREEIDKCK